MVIARALREALSTQPIQTCKTDLAGTSARRLVDGRAKQGAASSLHSAAKKVRPPARGKAPRTISNKRSGESCWEAVPPCERCRGAAAPCECCETMPRSSWRNPGVSSAAARRNSPRSRLSTSSGIFLPTAMPWPRQKKARHIKSPQASLWRRCLGAGRCRTRTSGHEAKNCARSWWTGAEGAES